MSVGAGIALGAVLGLALGIVVSVTTDVPLAPEAGLVAGGLVSALVAPAHETVVSPAVRVRPRVALEIPANRCCHDLASEARHRAKRPIGLFRPFPPLSRSCGAVGVPDAPRDQRAGAIASPASTAAVLRSRSQVARIVSPGP